MGELLLKFGDIKGGDFSGSAKSEHEHYVGRKNCVSDEDYKENAIRVIDLFNGKIIIWWDQTVVTKDQAKNYIRNYGKIDGTTEELIKDYTS